MKTKLFTLFFLLSLSGPAWCQFQTNISVSGMVYHDVCIEPLSFNVPQTTDYLVAGNLFDPALQSERMFIKKVDENGSVIWNKTYHETTSPHLRVLDIVSHLDLIFATGYIDIAGVRKVFLAQFDALNGNFLQSKYYDILGPNVNSTGLHISFSNSDANGDSTPDPGFIIAGYWSQCYNVDVNCPLNIGFVLRTDFALNVLWTVETDAPNNVNSLDYDFVNSITETNDGFFLTGSATWANVSNNTAQQVVLAHKLDFQGNMLWDRSYVFGNGSDVSADAYYDAATNKIYMLSNYSFSHYFAITVFDNNGTYDSVRSWYANDPNNLNMYGFTLMPSFNSPNNLVISGYDRDENWNIGSNSFYGESNVFMYEFDKNTGTPVGLNYQYLVPNVEPGSEDFNLWDFQMPIMYYPDMSFPKTDNSVNNHYYLAGYRVIDPAIVDVSLELFKVDPAKRNTCDSRLIAPNHTPLTKQNTPVTSGHVATTSIAITISATALPYVEDFCTRQLAIEENNIEKIQMYPNPAGEMVFFSGKELFNFNITEASGKIIAKGSLNNLRQIDISNLAVGLYFIEIFNSQNKRSFKLIKE
ncbi:MAG: T9SS type A sorting domain-containing protein [Aequorivita sp.]|nr:T9SS type A sorting domain-containing protein [Aequorivita sp.]